jgi:hypothetical protein
MVFYTTKNHYTSNEGSIPFTRSNLTLRAYIQLLT